MMTNTRTVLILLVGLATAASVQSSAIKGQQQQQAQAQAQAQQVQRLEEQAVRAVKSPVQQHSERSPKSSPVVQQQQQQAPVLESSKKVYNDESIRRSVSQAVAEPVVAVKSPPAALESSPVQAPVEPAPAQAQVAVPVPVAAPVSPIVEPLRPTIVEPAQPVAAPVAPVVSSVPVVPVVKASEELPPQSERSAPIKEEHVKHVVEASQPASVVVVEQVVPAKSPVVVEQVVPQQAPVVASKPIVESPAQVKQEYPVPVQQASVVSVKPEPVVAVQSKVVENKPEIKAKQDYASPMIPVASVAKEFSAEPQPIEVPVSKPMAESPLQAKQDYVIPVAPVAPAAPVVKEFAEPLPIEVPAPDPGLVLSEPIDSTTKLLIDLDEHVQKFLPAEDKQEPVQPAKDQVLVNGVDYSPAVVSEAQPSGKSSAPLVPYSSNVENEPIVPPLPSLEKVEKASGAQASPAGSAVVASGQSATRQANHQHQNQQQVITQLLDQLDSLQNRIQDTINQLVARRRYVMSALLRPMGTYVRRVRTNLERLQNRVNQLQAAAVSVGGNQNGQNRPGGFVDAAAIETIRRRIDDISKRISDIVNRIRFSLTPTSAPLNNNGRK